MQRVLLAGCVSCALAPASLAQTISWVGGSGISWTTGANWDPMNVPNLITESALIDLGAYILLEPGLPIDINQLTLSVPGIMLDLASSTHLGTHGATLINNGLITVNSDGQPGDASLDFTMGATITGSGEIRLNAVFASNVNDATLRNFAGGVVTNQAGHTISGTGQIVAAITNEGDILADVGGHTLELVVSPVTNHVLMSASGAGTLRLAGVAVTQGGGTISGGGGSVNLSACNVTGGTLAGPAFTSGTSTLNGVLVVGALDIPSGSALNIGTSGVTNDGVVRVNSNGGPGTCELRFTAGGTLDGSGLVVLDSSGGGLQVARIATTSGTLVHASGHTIGGTGQVGAALVNHGVVTADVLGATLDLTGNPKTNDNLMGATGGGVLLLSGLQLTQSAGARVAADNATVRLSGPTVIGGLLSSSGTGAIENPAGATSTLTDVTNGADLRVLAGGTVQIGGTGLTNNGVVHVNADGGPANAVLRFVQPGVLGGTGQVVLHGTLANPALAQLNASPLADLVQGPAHTIKGIGRMNGTVANGRVAPGLSAGRIEVVGGYSQGALGILEIELGGATPGTGHDQLVVTGPAALDGTLDVTLIGGFTPGANHQFIILTASSISGTFATVHLPTGPGIGFRVVYGPQNVTLVHCYADCDQNGSLNINDFICFQTKFALGDPYADCDGNGTRNIVDFICFQTKYALGCS